MIIGGYKIEDREDTMPEYIRLKEVSITCTRDELVAISDFFSNASLSLSHYTFPHGTCTLQFRDMEKSWEKGSPDIVLVVLPNNESEN